MVDITIKKNIYNFDMNDLFVIANRNNNSKRNFLFISKVLGKHLEISPNVNRVIGCMLTEEIFKSKTFNIDLFKKYIHNNNSVSEFKINNELNKYINTIEQCLVIGFAETATSLGMSVAASIKNSYYVHTTRVQVLDIESVFNFQENHSHAINHLCYLKNKEVINETDRIILVDDEITTGNSMLNLIEVINEKYPNKKYDIVSILDFRSDENIKKYKDLQDKLNVEINTYSIFSAEIHNINNTLMNDNINEETILNSDKEEKIIFNDFKKERHLLNNNKPFLFNTYSGRFGIRFDEIREIEKISKKIASDICLKYINESDKNILVLGHGEDMYIASRIANYLNAKFKSTTRSPIFVKETMDYPINDRKKIIINNTTFYIYNLPKLVKKYDKILFISEFDINLILSEKLLTIKI